MELNDRERQLVLILIETLTLKAPDELVEVAMGLRKKLLARPEELDAERIAE